MAEKAEPASLTDRLARLNTCAVSDAMDWLGLKNRACSLAAFGARHSLSGSVRTVRLARRPREAVPTGYHLGVQMLESCLGGEVIVVEQVVDLNAAASGGLLTILAKRNGIQGVITNRRIRDTEVIAELDFTVYASGSTPQTARGMVFEAALDAPVLISCVTVVTGDYVIADRSCVAFVPASDAEWVIEAAEQIVRQESESRARLLAGASPSEVFGKRYEGRLKR